MNSNNIKALIFDIGSVLIHLEPIRSQEYYEALGITNDQIKNLEKNALFDQFEKGQLSPEQFYESFVDKASKHFSFSNFKEAWNSYLGQNIIGLEELISKLSLSYDLYLLSNTNELHWHKLKQRPLFKYFKKSFLSFELNLMKPDPQIYLKLLAEINLEPSEVLYLDDKAENIAAAKKLGINSSLVFESIKQIRYALSLNKIYK